MISMSPMERLGRAGFSKGFTLIETLMAIVLLGLGVFLLLWAFSQGVAASNDAQDLRTATALAQAKMADLRDTAYASLADEARAAVSGFAGFERYVDVTASPGGTDTDLTQIDVTVYWTLTGGESSTTLTTFMENH